MPLGAAKPNRVDLLSCVTRSIPLNQNPESENEHVVSPVWLTHTHTAMALTRVQKPLIVLQGHIFLILRDYRTRNGTRHTLAALDLLEPSWYYQVTQLTLPII